MQNNKTAVNKARELPSKESSAFKSILKLYENKQYKKGIKTADQILKKFPEHGETLSMKGLILSQMDRKEEAFELVKKGVKYDLTSHICWHVYGLLHRADKNFEEAVKCYKQALKFDKENIQIIRDLSLLQIQMRNYEGYNESRHLLLKLKPANRAYWIGLVISYHLLKKYQKAIEILDAFEASLQEVSLDFEESELILYKNQMIEESGNIEKALEHLDSKKSEIVDILAFKEKRAEFFLKLNKKEEAEACYKDLIEYNPYNMMYYSAMEQCLGLSRNNEEQLELIKKYYKGQIEKTPKCYSLQRELLLLTKGDEFEVVLRNLIDTLLKRGIPSAFVNFKVFYKRKNVEAIQAIEKIAFELKETYATTVDDPKSKTSLIWAHHFLAQHADAQGELKQALSFIEKAIELAGSEFIVELFMIQARILKHQGNFEEAAKVMNRARELDMSDRFVNTKCVKYLLRAGKLAEAEKIVTLFTKQGEFIDQLADLVEMQCMWFALEYGEAALKNGSNFGLALKRFHQVQSHFNDIIEDQFDFHTYSLRKNCIRAYVDMLKMEDKLYSFPYYKRAASNAIKIYLNLHDAPPTDNLIKSLSKLKVAATSNQDSKNSAARKTVSNAAKDDDPLGLKYLSPSSSSSSFLDSALQLLNPLLKQSPTWYDAFSLGFEIYLRKESNPLMTLKMIKTCFELQPENPRNYVHLQAFYQFYQSKAENMNEAIRKFLLDFFNSHNITGDSTSALEVIRKGVSSHASNSHPSNILTCEFDIILNNSSGEKQESILEELRSTFLSKVTRLIKDLSIKEALSVLSHVQQRARIHEWLNTISKELIEVFKQKYPDASCF